MSHKPKTKSAEITRLKERNRALAAEMALGTLRWRAALDHRQPRRPPRQPS